MIKRLIAYSILILFLFSLPLSVQAGAPLDTIKADVDQVLDLLREKNLDKEKKKEKLRVMYERMFDEVELSKRTLGLNWNKLNPAQQQEFVKLFRQVLEKAYIDKILSYTNEKINFTRENMLSNNQAEVQTKVITSSREIPIFYRVILKDNTWKVYDVVVENVSLVQNYRSQFKAILANHTPDQMLEILQKKVKGQQGPQRGRALIQTMKFASPISDFICFFVAGCAHGPSGYSPAPSAVSSPSPAPVAVSEAVPTPLKSPEGADASERENPVDKKNFRP